MDAACRTFTIDLAKHAGKIMKTNFTLGMKKEWKSDNTPLTETDLTINALVLDSIKKKFPGHSVLAEEGSNVSEGSEYVWVCDPVDGTTPFSHGIPTCVFSLALVQKGTVMLGVVYDPFIDRMFVGEKGKGASLNGKKISVSRSTTLANAIVGFVNSRRAPYDFSDLYQQLLSRQVKLLDVGSIAYMHALVACGEFAATIFPYDQPHDTAAIKVIVEEAGGMVTDLFGNEQRYDRANGFRGHLVSNGVLHHELVNIITSTVKTKSS